MPSIRDFIDPGGRMLAHRLDQFCSTLECLGEKLRSTIANAIGETIGCIVRDAALHALDEVAQRQTDAETVRGPFSRPGPLSVAQPHLDRNEPDYWADKEQERFEPYEVNQPTPAPTERLPAALSAGLQTASWWLRRWSGRGRTLTTLAIGLVATGIAFLGGPLVIAVLGLAQSATQFTSLSDVIGTRLPA
jgi:hypothetical protein